MAPPPKKVDVFDSEMAAYVKGISDGIKCKSCGKFAVDSLRHLSCGHLACLRCLETVDNSCPECDVTITPADIHESDFLQTLQNYIQQLDILYKDVPADSVQEDEKNSEEPLIVVPTSLSKVTPSKHSSETANDGWQSAQHKPWKHSPLEISMDSGKKKHYEEEEEEEDESEFRKPKTPAKKFSEHLVKAGIVTKGEGKSKRGSKEGKNSKGKRPIGHLLSSAETVSSVSSPVVSSVATASPVRTSSRQRKPKIYDEEEFESDSSQQKKISPVKVSKKKSKFTAETTTEEESTPQQSKAMSPKKRSPRVSESVSSRDSSVSSKKVGLLGTALNEKQKSLLTKFKDSFSNVKIYDDWDEKVTHVVGACEKGTRTTTRTLKYMKGLLGNKWLVSIKWIEASIKANKIISEDDYELVGTKKQDVKDHGAPMRSRVAGQEASSPSKRGSKGKVKTSESKLFHDMIFYFDGKFHGKEGIPNITELRKLIELGGGKVTSVRPNERSADRVLVIVEDEKKLNVAAACKKVGVKTLFSFIENFDVDEDLFN